MRKIDFLSPSPNNYIFQKESNKTTFGGFLSILFLIVTFIIYLFYRVDIWLIYRGRKDRYEISSFISQENH